MFFDVDPLEAVDALHGSPLEPAAEPRTNAPEDLPALGAQEYFASSLFAAGQGGSGEPCRQAPLATLDSGHEIRFTGERLGQDDLDVFLACLELAAAGTGTARFDANRMLRRLGRRVDTPGRHRLAASLWRLEAGQLELAQEQRRVRMRLFNTVLMDRLDGACLVDVHATVMHAFRKTTGLTALLHGRLSMKGSPLAQWLLGLTRVLPEDRLLAQDRLRALCGCPEETPARFAKRLRLSLHRLADTGHPSSIFIRPGGVLHVRRAIARDASGNSL